MATLSDQLLMVTVLAYLVTMVCHAAEYAFGSRTRTTARPAGAARPATVAAGPSGGTAVTVAPGPTDPADAGTRDAPAGGADGGRADLLGRAAVVTLLVAAAVHAATLVTRSLAAGRLPWGNMYEYLLTATLIGVVAWLGVLARHHTVRHLGLYVSLVNLLLLGLVGMVAYTPVAPVRPALDSSWFVIHVGAATLAFGVFSVGFVAAVMHQLRTGHEAGKRRFPYVLGRRVPDAAAVERLTFRLHAFAFPIWTFAIVAGAIWAEAAWSRYWGWDPKEVWAFISWVAYAAYLHARATPSVKRTLAGWLAILGYLTVLMNLFGVNLFFESLHSYA